MPAKLQYYARGIDQQVRLPMPTITKTPMGELILRVALVTTFSTLLALWLAIGTQPNKNAPDAKHIANYSDDQKAQREVAEPSAIGHFPQLTAQKGISLDQVAQLLNKAEVVADTKFEGLYKFTKLAGRTRLLLIVDSRREYGDYLKLCDSLPIDCIVMALVRGTSEPSQLATPATSLPILRLKVPLGPSPTGDEPPSPGTYVFDHSGRLIWHNTFYSSWRTLEVVLRTAVSMTPPAQAAGLRELPRAGEPTPQPSTERPPLVQEQPVKDQEGPAIQADEKQQPRDRKPTNLRLKQLTSRVIPVQDPASKSPFSATWAVKEAVKKKRPVLLNFWGTWCLPCINEIPELAELSRRYPAVLFIGLIDDPNTPEKRKFVLELVSPHSVLSLQYFTEDYAMFRQVTGMGDPNFPAFAVFDSDGKLVGTTVGTIKNADSLKNLEESLKKVGTSETSLSTQVIPEATAKERS